jgi:hypothetical protein
VMRPGHAGGAWVWLPRSPIMLKLKFKPRISHIKLNPEQAVLQCNCQFNGTQVDWSTTVPDTAYGSAGSPNIVNTICTSGERVNPWIYVVSYPSPGLPGANGSTGSASSS